MAMSEKLPLDLTVREKKKKVRHRKKRELEASNCSFEIEGSRVALSRVCREEDMWREEDVAESKECELEEVVGRHVSPSNSGVNLIEGIRGERQGASNSVSVLNPIKELENSKLFGIQNHLGFSFVTDKEELTHGKKVVDIKEQSSKSLAPRENVKGSQ